MKDQVPAVVRSSSKPKRSTAVRPLAVGLVGCGAIGTYVAAALAKGRIPGAALAALNDLVPERAAALARRLGTAIRVLNLRELCRACDLVIEAAGQEAVPAIARQVLAGRAELLVMSVGALVLEPQWLKRFTAAGRPLHYPSGAVAGLDALHAAAAEGLDRVELVTRKPAASLPGGTGRTGRGPRAPRLLFAGTAKEAVRRFPRNMNVAAAVALAGIGPVKTRVRILADPDAHYNTHVLTASGAFGRLQAMVENHPSAENPKTSRLAAASAVAAIADLARRRARRPAGLRP